MAITDHNVFGVLDTVQAEKIVLIPGVEHDLTYSNANCLHLVGVRESPETTNYSCRKYTPSEMTAKQLVKLMQDDGQLVVLAHPVWSRMEVEEILELDGILGIEVYNNGAEHLCHAGRADVYWDILLKNKRRVWGFACDDTHKKEDLFGGWICVKVNSPIASDIMASIVNGQFYASNGPTIMDFGTIGDQVYLKCSGCREIHFVSYPTRGKSFFATDGGLIQEAVYTRKAGEAYIRAECVVHSGRIAWTNPIFFDE